jgi:hypothetical protein
MLDPQVLILRLLEYFPAILEYPASVLILSLIMKLGMKISRRNGSWPGLGVMNRGSVGRKR